MIDFRQEDHQDDGMARVIDRMLLVAAMLSLTFGVATGVWGLLH